VAPVGVVPNVARYRKKRLYFDPVMLERSKMYHYYAGKLKIKGQFLFD
jgi:hypothetical protein